MKTSPSKTRAELSREMQQHRGNPAKLRDLEEQYMAAPDGKDYGVLIISIITILALL